MDSKESRPARRRRGVRRAAATARNVLEIMRLGRLTARTGAAFDVVHRGDHYRLRRYASASAEERRAPLLLVPPLMLTAEIYDVAESISAARSLTEAGVDVWVVDFGAPENVAGGMTRTLDDHVRAVADAVGRVRDATGGDVHLAGYSQGGMFCYQAAAYRKSDGVASIITFGSPVDIHQNLPNVSTDLTARLIRAWRPLVEPPLRMVDGLPGVLTSTGFKLFSFRKELQQVAEFLSVLHDRRALEKRESRRRFLAGEGFVAWPGPALLQFIDEFVVHNRMLSGGFVVDGRTVTLADIDCPILYFVGDRDDIARPPSVRAIQDAAPKAEVFEVTLRAGHFGLVVGSTAMRETWPIVVDFLRWQHEGGQKPAALSPPPSPGGEPRDFDDVAFDAGQDIELFYDTALRTVESAWKQTNEVLEDVGDTVDQLRYQLPKLLRLRRIEDDTRISPSLTLARQARRIGDQTFFLYRGRAVTFSQANERVDNVVRGLIQCDVRPGMHVGVLMRPRPSYLSVVQALSRLGAIAVVISPEADAETLTRATGLGRVEAIVADPESAALARAAFDGAVLVLGGGPHRSVIDGVTDMEAIDPAQVELPSWYRPNPGRAEDVYLVFVTASRTDSRAARITNRRWAFSAYGAAAACTLTPNDTVYCCLPLHHPSGLLVASGAALASGARLALATSFSADVFWDEVRRYGATVAFYAGEMCRELVDAPARRGERGHPLRLLAGSGMRADVWRRLGDRFGVGVVEFYAATEVSFVLANAGGKVGSIGRPLPGSREGFLAAFDLDRGDFVRDRRGRILPAQFGQPGMLLARVDPSPLAPLDERAPVSKLGATHLPRVTRGVFEERDRWFVTGDLMRRDEDGDYWYLDRLANLVRTREGPVVTRPVEDALYDLPEVRLAAAYGMGEAGTELIMATVVVRGSDVPTAASVEAALHARLPPPSWPSRIAIRPSIAMTDGFRALKVALTADGPPGPPGFVLGDDGHYALER